MRRNPLGDCVFGLLGGTLTVYFSLAALLVLLTGQGPSLGPALPIEAAPDSGAWARLVVRLLQAFCFSALAALAFVGCRLLQERLRGHRWASALREALTGPQLW
jgi:hypothetical protein